MLFKSARRATHQVFRPKFRQTLVKSIGLTIALFVGLWFVLSQTIDWIFGDVLAQYAWLDAAVGWMLGTGVIIAGGFILAPVTALFAGFFLDDLADDLEANAIPPGPVGRPRNLTQSIAQSIKFLILVLLVNLICLILLLVPGINLIIFFLANGFLLGREYFEFVALRHLDAENTKLLRKRFEGTIFAAGLLISAVLSIPVVNLLTPFFATAMMVSLFREAKNSTSSEAQI